MTEDEAVHTSISKDFTPPSQPSRGMTIISTGAMDMGTGMRMGAMFGYDVDLSESWSEVCNPMNL